VLGPARRDGPLLLALRRCGGCLGDPTGTAPRGHGVTPANAIAATPESRSPAASTSRAPRTPPGLASDGRFAPGMVLGERFRIVGLLGRGGMGEVYRADDLRLGQAVALKFLPEAVRGDAERLARLHTEVRLAREVSHPNVCRVHDVGELDGQTFLSMERGDGSDCAARALVSGGDPWSSRRRGALSSDLTLGAWPPSSPRSRRSAGSLQAFAPCFATASAARFAASGSPR
jgi:hypothetical protein